MQSRYDVIVIGGGHAGVEASWAAAGALRDGGKVALITMDPSRIGQMSCNPAIGGLGKGQMVREIDALGGVMSRAIDATGILFHMLNMSRGPAVRGPRAQADKYAYAAEVQRILLTRPNIDVIAATIDDLLIDDDGSVCGVRVPTGAGVVGVDDNAVRTNVSQRQLAQMLFKSTPDQPISAPKELHAPSVVLTTGTFMRGLMHTGETQTPGGRVEEGSAEGISGMLVRLGFELGRLKTGTPPRLSRRSIDWESLEAQCADAEPIAFSDQSPQCLEGGRFPQMPQIECRISSTTPEAHALIRDNLHRAPMYSGAIDAEAGPRYCPSIEDKVVRFADRESHHVFLEPESLYSDEIYCNGISTSLPQDVQRTLVSSMPGCANADILRWGYAVEYDMVWPHQIDATCMTKRVPGLFLAGQINCTTGYEEAAAQGVVAGVNASLWARGQTLRRLGRDQAYIGVMMDDLVTKTPREPYRMFTSRAEYRLLLRGDNADERLTPWARDLGLIDDEHWSMYGARASSLHDVREAFDSVRIEGRSLRVHARRPQVEVTEIAEHLPFACDGRLIERVMTDARYDGYISRQRAEIKRQRLADETKIPSWLVIDDVRGLRSEASDVLKRFAPATMGQAGRLPGVNPADLTVLAVAIKRGPIQDDDSSGDLSSSSLSNG